MEYERYFKFVTHVLDAFTTRFAPKDGTQEQEVMVIRDLALRFLITLKALGLKYLFEDQEQMRIDLTASGFPNHMELRKLGADLELLKKGALPSVNVEHIKRQLLDKLIGGESDPFPLLRSTRSRIAPMCT